MKLSEYLEKNDLSQEAFGLKIGVKRLAVLRYINKQRVPSPKTAKRIIKVTKNEVTLDDLYR